MHVGAVTFAVEDHDQFGGAVHGDAGVGGHRGELGGLAGLDEQLPVAEQQHDPAHGDEQPVVAGVNLLLRPPIGGLEAHLDGCGVAGRPAQHPRRAPFGIGRDRADDHVVVLAHVEQRVEVDLQGAGQRYEHIEADGPVPGFDAADGGGAEVRPGGEVVEREPQRVAQAAQPRAHDTFHLVGVAHVRLPFRFQVLRIPQDALR